MSAEALENNNEGSDKLLVCSLLKKCAPDTLPPGIRDKVVGEATVIAQILNTILSLEDTSLWPQDFQSQVGEAIRLVGTLGDGRVIFSKVHSVIPETPKEFLLDLEHFLRPREQVKKTIEYPEEYERPRRKEEQTQPPFSGVNRAKSEIEEAYAEHNDFGRGNETDTK